MVDPASHATEILRPADPAELNRIAGEGVTPAGRAEYLRGGPPTIRVDLDVLMDPKLIPKRLAGWNPSPLTAEESRRFAEDFHRIRRCRLPTMDDFVARMAIHRATELVLGAPIVLDGEDPEC